MALPGTAVVEAVAPETTLDSSTPGLENRNGVLYVQGQPYSGFLAEREFDGSSSRTPYVDGRRHGLAQGRYRGGQLAWQRAFRLGLRQGVANGWWPNGQLQFRRHYRSDVFEGEQWAWYESGAQFEVRRYIAGREEGRQTAWAEDGRVVANYVFKDGRRYGIVGRFDCVTVRTP